MAAGIRAKVMNEYNIKRYAEAIKMCGDIWKKMSEEEKAPFQEKSKQQFEIYRLKLAEYKKTTSFTEFAELRKDAGLKPVDPNAPKKPANGFFL